MRLVFFNRISDYLSALFVGFWWYLLLVARFCCWYLVIDVQILLRSDLTMYSSADLFTIAFHA